MNHIYFTNYMYIYEKIIHTGSKIFILFIYLGGGGVLDFLLF